MDWTTIIVALLSGTTIGSIVEAIRYRRQNSQLKANEVTLSSVDTQKAEIDLANLYKNEMLKVIDLLKSSQTESSDNHNQIIKKLNILDKRLDILEINYNNLSEWANGSYHNFLAHKEQLKQD